jgi:hypothetical protein
VVIAEALPLVVDELRLPSVLAGDGVEPVVGDGFSVADISARLVRGSCPRSVAFVGWGVGATALSGDGFKMREMR